MTCKECVHYDVCMDYTTLSESELAQKFDQVEKLCDHFKPKSRFVELPCEVGQTVYVLVPKKYREDGEWVDVLTAEKVSCACVYGEFDTIISAEDFGKTVFLSIEEAEKALKEREIK